MSYTYAGTYSPQQITNNEGAPLKKLPISVFVHGTSTLATLYTGRTKGATVANPTATDGSGNLAFFADPGQYDITGNGATITVVLPVDPAEPLTGDASGVLPSVVLQKEGLEHLFPTGTFLMTNTVPTDESTTSTAWGDLYPTAGPIVGPYTGTRALVILTAQLYSGANSTTGDRGGTFMGFEVSGASTVTPSVDQALYTGPDTPAEPNSPVQASALYVVSNLTAGQNIFTAKYRTDIAGCPAHFLNRSITVIGLW